MQIIFESLPVSSSGNVALWIPLLDKRLLLTGSLNALPAFDFLLHIPSFLIISIFFFDYWFFYIKSFQKSFKSLALVTTWCLIADSVTLIFYFFLKEVGTAFFDLSFGFLITTVFLFSLFFYKKTKHYKKIKYKDALIIGFVQGCALLPGVSRLATTFVTAVWLGYKDTTAFAYSFLIQSPLIVAAGTKAIFKIMNEPLSPVFFQKDFYLLILGSSIISFCLLGFVFGMVKRKTFWMFGWYTLFLASIAFCLKI